MHIFTRSPSGIISHIPLESLIWRLELTYSAEVFGLGIRYVAPAGANPTAISMICGISIKVEEARPAMAVARVGFPKATKEENITRLQEAIKTLVNVGVKDREVETICAESVHLVHTYYEIESILRTGSSGGGSFQGWRWAISPKMTGWNWASEEIKDEPSD